MRGMDEPSEPDFTMKLTGLLKKHLNVGESLEPDESHIYVRANRHGDAPDVAIKCSCGEVIVYRVSLGAVDCDKCGEVWFERPTLWAMSNHSTVAEIVPLPPKPE